MKIAEVDTPETVRSSEAVAEFVNTTKAFGEVRAANNLNLRIKRGEFLSFLGPSGCGKTTALRMLAGFESPTSGEVLLDGQAVGARPAHKRPVNMVFQHYALFPHMTVAQNVGYGLRQRRPKMAKAEIAAKVDKALATVRLQEFGPRRIWEMSGGQQQRVALARAIVNEPKILLLDEPMAALDAKLRGEMQSELLSLQRQLGITFVLVTHDQEEAMAMSDRICLMGQGRIAQIGTPEDLYDRPANRYVADFIGKANILPATITDRADGMARAVLANGAQVVLRDRAGDTQATPEVAIRPEALMLMGPDDQPGPGDAVLTGRVTHRTFLGDMTEYLLQTEALGVLQMNVPRQAARAMHGAGTGETARLLWAKGAGLVLGPMA
ncbi:ABC transporter ATP-binding protein [Thioclava sp. GXIMD2076]|uniref:ABC transporter ATP-binding protein n=1 Tax=Thioclava sp. GXIMD2076 TaxID=3131931 RepID=UPI0030CBDDE4